MNTDQTDKQKTERKTKFALSFYDSFLIGVNPRLSVAVFVVVGVGIEPTFRAFQTHAKSVSAIRPSEIRFKTVFLDAPFPGRHDHRVHP